MQIRTGSCVALRHKELEKGTKITASDKETGLPRTTGEILAKCQLLSFSIYVMAL